MGTSLTGPEGRRGRLVSIICTFAALVALYFVLRTAALAVAPAWAASLPPVNPVRELREEARLAAHPEFKVSPQLVQLATSAAPAEPLGYLPFYVSARAAEGAGDLARATSLLEEARRRRPTWLPIRLLLVSNYVRQNRHQEVVRNIDYVLRMNEQARIVLLPELVKLLRYPEGRRYIDAMLASNPPWEKDFFFIARERKVPPQIAAELLRLAQARGGDTTEEQRLYVNSLIQAGQADVARSRWLESLPADQRERSRFLHNGDFRSSGPPGEFGWEFAAVDVGRADVLAGGEQSLLRAQYYGGSLAVLAKQQIALAPGRYRIQVTGRIASGSGAAQMSWRVSCHPDGPNLVTVAAGALEPQDKTIAAEFSVPAGRCSAQRLQLVGEPGDVSAPVEAEFRRIELTNVR